MGILLCWNDQIRPVDKLTFFLPHLEIHIKIIIPVGRKTLPRFTVVSPAALLNNDPVSDVQQGVIWCSKVKGTECQCPPLLFNLFSFQSEGRCPCCER